MKTALVTGANGQDGSYLAEFLLEKEYKVIGIRRRASIEDNSNLENVLSHPNFSLLYGDLTDYCSIFNLINTHKPDEIYNLAAQSFVGVSFDQPLYTWQVNAQGVVNILEVVRSLKSDTYNPRIYQASTSEMFGYKYDEKIDYKFNYAYRSGSLIHTIYDGIDIITTKYQDENTEMDPQSPYGVAKLAGHKSVGLYRRAYGLFACSGILFNHESPRRGKQFVTRKITDYIGKLKKCVDWAEYEGDCSHVDNFPKLKLGNIDAYRDWGHSRDYVEAMWLMLQQDTPDDFVICTGETHTVREFLQEAFSHVGLNWEDFVVIDQSLFRPAEVDYLRGDCSKAKKILGWEPKTTFKELVHEMVDSDVQKAR